MRISDWSSDVCSSDLTDLQPLRDKGILQVLNMRAPAGFGASDDFNGGNIIAFLRPWEDRTVTSAPVADTINTIIPSQPGVRGNVTARSGLGRGRGLPATLVLAGSSLEGRGRKRGGWGKGGAGRGK